MGGHNPLDKWARWMLHDRFGGSEEAMRANMSFLEPLRDRVLDNAQIEEGDVVLDVGCGDGLIGFGALGRVGSKGRVIFSDISQDLLDHCEEAFDATGVRDQSTTAQTSAETLEGIATESVDVVTTRSVLIYVDDKRAAFDSFYRVLRPGGRISLFEPINRRMNEMNRGSFLGLNTSGVEELASKVQAVFVETAPEAMMGFDEGDLFRLGLQAGFNQVSVTLELKSNRVWFDEMDWSQTKNTSPNPMAPTISQAMHKVLSPEEVCRLDEHLVRAATSGVENLVQTAYAFVTAMKPG